MDGVRSRTFSSVLTQTLRDRSQMNNLSCFSYCYLGKRTKVDPPDKKTKRQRSGVGQRNARNKNNECSIVKCSLKSFCQESASVFPWDNVLKDTNKAVAEAYILANLRVARFCQAGRPIPVLDQEFYLLPVSVNRKCGFDSSEEG
ncbi:hypothetical protein BBJ28_00024552 [Nothophytophthora sp. Chile5]|nr:hypothetical protein BBJ28_00024552 [Nothophytophthora sp. Chile5]